MDSAEPASPPSNIITAPTDPASHTNTVLQLDGRGLDMGTHRLTGELFLGKEEFVSAQARVLSSPELLVNILSQLPHSSLLKAQRVHKTWADLFATVEIQAALFQRPRPARSPEYVEPYSDILQAKFPAFFPTTTKASRGFSRRGVADEYPIEAWSELPIDNAHNGGVPSKALQHGTPLYMRSRKRPRIQCPHRHKWSEMLVAQPPIRALELIQQVQEQFTNKLEFRAVISCPNGLRMGLLYDAVKHCHEVEGSGAELLWNRRTGDTTAKHISYVDGTGFGTDKDQPL
ncbi:hypothetical protein NLG97_g3554 [Lecanicillium saksenae]|uniref:Uncharacterized protein n=1 Tax=Lecanicillium saksenae TaxID=468837 RepID=A0ACC1QZN6_9HYPO|nr:hypothetical protein NLG97_g3554 [Lecanicillium saksenae]